MKTARTQDEFDMAIRSARSSDRIYIRDEKFRIHDCGMALAVNIGLGASVDADGCFILIGENQSISTIVRDSIILVTYGRSRSKATDFAMVTAHDGSFIEIDGKSSAIASDYSTVYAKEHSSIFARHHSTVYASGDARVWAFDRAKIWLSENASVVSSGNEVTIKHIAKTPRLG